MRLRSRIPLGDRQKALRFERDGSGQTASAGLQPVLHSLHLPRGTRKWPNRPKAGLPSRFWSPFFLAMIMDLPRDARFLSVSFSPFFWYAGSETGGPRFDERGGLGF